MDFRLEDKVALVTGATRGIGFSVAQALAEEGAHVVGAARSITPGLREISPGALAVDLSTPAGPAKLVEHALSEYEGIDVLINNAGSFVARTGGFSAVTDEQWRETLELNLIAPVRLTRAALPSLIERQGSIINVSSIRTRVPNSSVVDYAAAKAGLTNLGKTLAQELAAKGVRVNTVSPGPTLTSAWTAPGGFGEQAAAAGGSSLPDFLRNFPGNAGLATGRMTEPEEVAAVVVLLASDRVANATGVDYAIDGGLLKAI